MSGAASIPAHACLHIQHTSSCACSHYIPHTTSRVCLIIIHIPARVCLINFNRPHGLNNFNRPHGTFGPCTRGEKGRTMCTSLSHMGCIGAVTTALFFGLTRPRQRAVTTAHPYTHAPQCCGYNRNYRRVCAQCVSVCGHSFYHACHALHPPEHSISSWA